MDIEVESDDSWKEEARREKEKLDEELKREKARKSELPPEPTFGQFLTTLAAQALMALGEAENPVTRTKEVDLPAAKYVIDVISLLKDKTKGNLTEAEEATLTQLLTELRLKFVKASGTGKS